MGKGSVRKRRRKSKHKADLDRIRGISLMDVASPDASTTRPDVTSDASSPVRMAHPLAGMSPSPFKTKVKKVSVKVGRVYQDPLPIQPQTPQRKRIEFVLPKATGKPETYDFGAQAKAKSNEALPDLSKGNVGDVGKASAAKAKKQNDTIDDIFGIRKKNGQREEKAEKQFSKPNGKSNVLNLFGAKNEATNGVGNVAPGSLKTPTALENHAAALKPEVKDSDSTISPVKPPETPKLDKQKDITTHILLKPPAIPKSEKKKEKHTKAIQKTLVDSKLEEKKEITPKSAEKKAITPKSDTKRDKRKKELQEPSATSKSGEQKGESKETSQKAPENQISNEKKSKLKARKVKSPKENGKLSTVPELEPLEVSGKKRKSKGTPIKDPSPQTPKKAGNGNDREGKLSGVSVAMAVRDKAGLRPRANSTDGELNLPQRGLCDERIVLASYRWKTEPNYLRQVTPMGLTNIGNTCFLNSTLQCLAYLPPFCQTLIAMSEAKMSRPDAMKKQLTQGQRITQTLTSLFQRIHGSDGGRCIAPKAIVNALPTIGSCGSRNGYNFRPGRQEDAHEFLVHLLDAMHDGELRAAGINQHVSGWRDRLPAPRLDETTFIHRIFGGYLRSQVKCTTCGYRSNTYDPFLDLSLEVSKKSSNSISSAFAEFTRKETLDSDNKWKCSGCMKYVCATKQLTVFRPPLSLCIQLKRFTFRSGFGGRALSPYAYGSNRKMGKKRFRLGGGAKISKPIEFPANLDLPLSDGRTCTYSLTGVVTHVGSSASSGHYTAFVKKQSRKGTEQWYLADDSIVESVSERSVLQHRDAYVLFYCRKEVVLEFPSPPPRGSMSAEEAMSFGRTRSRARADSINSKRSDNNESESESENDSDNSQPATPATVSEAMKRAASESSDDEDGNDSPDGAVKSELASIDTMNFMRLGSPVPVIPNPNRTLKPSSAIQVNAFSIVPRGGKETKMRSLASIAATSSLLAADPIKQAQIEGGESSSSVPSSSSSTSSSDESSTDGGAANVKAHSSPDPPALEKNHHNSSNSSDSESLEEEDINASTRAQHPCTTNKEKGGKRTHVVINRADSRGKVEVMIGPRGNRRAWKAKTQAHGTKDQSHGLLGNFSVGTWGDNEDDIDRNATRNSRTTIISQMEKKDLKRKRGMFLDRWDSALDQGKTKKVKSKFPEASDQTSQPSIFQRIQSSINHLTKGKPKGSYRRIQKGRK